MTTVVSADVAGVMSSSRASSWSCHGSGCGTTAGSAWLIDRARRGQVFAPQIARAAVQQQDAFERERGRDVGRERAGIGSRGRADGRGGLQFLLLPGLAGQFEQGGQGQGAVAAEQQLPRTGPGNLAGQRGGGRFLRT